ncbi:hypothetical protein Ae201684P_019176 [Aphanomyces euteiches]|nr:hypothetical protein Ae201684P_019176 [Aphanomyces euteiches]
MDLAAHFGHLNVVKFLHINRTEGCSSEAMELAAEHGHMEVLQWLHANRSEGCSSYAMDHAARNGHLEIVQWLHAQGYECTHKAMRYAYENGHFSVVKWLHAFRTEGCLRSIYLQPILGDATMTSAKEMIEWLCVNRCEIDPSLLLRQAVAMSQMDIIELLLDRFGVPWTSDLAARHKQVDVLRWIYARNPLLIDQKMLEIAQEGSSSLEVIRWLCEDVGVAVSHQVFEYSGFSQDVDQWLLDTNRLDDDTIQLRQTCTNNERKFE